MEDLTYIFNLGFSGTDLWRAVGLSFLLGMFVSKKRSVWMLAFWGLIFDRVIWPLGAQAAAGAEPHTIYASIGAMFQSFPIDLGFYVVRYLGLVAMTAFFMFIRVRIHKPFTPKKNKAAAA